MAIYHKHLAYHEDTIEKHVINYNEIQFLIKLQKEMNTQDHLCQADPRYWVIKGSKKFYGVETGHEDGSELIDIEDNTTVARSMEEAAEFIRDNLLSDINSFDGIDRKIELIDGAFHKNIRVYWKEDDFEDYVEFDNMEEVTDWLNENGYEYRIVNYIIEDIIYPNTMFLTQKAAENHLKANHYHYSDDAHTYAMTSWRNEETRMLWNILQTVDWSKCEYKEEIKK